MGVRYLRFPWDLIGKRISDVSGVDEDEVTLSFDDGTAVVLRAGEYPDNDGGYIFIAGPEEDTHA